MKRVLFLIILSIIFNLTTETPSNAIQIFGNNNAVQKAHIKKAKIEKLQFEQAQKAKIQQEKVYRNEIVQLFSQIDEFSKKYDIDSLKKLYSENFIDNDGYTKDVYFSLVQDTWNTYPRISYATKIKNININGNYAIVETEETSIAVADDLTKNLKGELYSQAKCIYHLRRVAHKWKVTNENVLEEVSTLKYGDARFVGMDIEVPQMVGAGQEYTATLNVDLPSSNLVVASINQEKIINPVEKSEEIIRRLDETQSLARSFYANTDNVNEYIVASVGVTKSEEVDDETVRVYPNGLAFVMVRVNVVPKNNFAKVDENKTKEKI